MRILLVEDHPQLAESVAQVLKGAGWTVDVLHDGIAADLALASEDYALAVLDVGLPRMDGFEVLARLRGRGKTLPVLMLTARGEVKDRVHGLNLGADDYLAKPCDPRELTARLRAVLRRTLPPQQSSQLELGDLCYSPVRGVVTIGDHEISLTLSEGRLLEALLRQPGEPLDKQQLAQLALGRKLTLYDRSLDMHVSNLRKKLGPHADGRPRILALRSRGYYYSA